MLIGKLRVVGIATLFLSSIACGGGQTGQPSDETCAPPAEVSIDEPLPGVPEWLPSDSVADALGSHTVPLSWLVEESEDPTLVQEDELTLTVRYDGGVATRECLPELVVPVNVELSTRDSGLHDSGPGELYVWAPSQLSQPSIRFSGQQLGVDAWFWRSGGAIDVAGRMTASPPLAPSPVAHFPTACAGDHEFSLDSQEMLPNVDAFLAAINQLEPSELSVGGHPVPFTLSVTTPRQSACEFAKGFVSLPIEGTWLFPGGETVLVSGQLELRFEKDTAQVDRASVYLMATEDFDGNLIDPTLEGCVAGDVTLNFELDPSDLGGARRVQNLTPVYTNCRIP